MALAGDAIQANRLLAWMRTITASSLAERGDASATGLAQLGQCSDADSPDIVIVGIDPHRQSRVQCLAAESENFEGVAGLIIVRERALGDVPVDRRSTGLVPRELLTPREVAVLRYLATGATNQEIAQALGVSVNTVKKHATRVFGKLRVRSRSEAAIAALGGWMLGSGRRGARGSAGS